MGLALLHNFLVPPSSRLQRSFPRLVLPWAPAHAQVPKRYVAGFQVLLILNVFVRRHHQLKSGLLRGVEQLAIFEFFPSPRPRLLDGVISQDTSQVAVCRYRRGSTSWRRLAIARGFFERARHKGHKAFQLSTGYWKLFD